MKEQVKAYLDKLAQKQGIVLEDETNLFESGVLDSLGIIMLLTYIMEELKLEINVEDLEYQNYENLNSIYKWLDEIT